MPWPKEPAAAAVTFSKKPFGTARIAGSGDEPINLSGMFEPDLSMTLSACNRHVVLVAPEVHWNTGNIGRTCLGVGAMLHLIRPLGFSLADRQVKRAGLDYWPRVPLRVWDDFDQFTESMAPGEAEIALLTKSGAQPYWRMPMPNRLFMVFGSETRGLPASLLTRYSRCTFFIPMQSQIRCLNLSTAVGIVLYENLRQWAMRLSL